MRKRASWFGIVKYCWREHNGLVSCCLIVVDCDKLEAGFCGMTGLDLWTDAWPEVDEDEVYTAYVHVYGSHIKSSIIKNPISNPIKPFIDIFNIKISSFSYASYL